MVQRRKAIKILGGAVALGLASAPLLAAVDTDKRFVVVLLRGGMDGLSAVPAFGDPDFERARAGLALAPPGKPGGALRLNDFFGLHPKLPGLAALYHQGELAVVHAAATAYRERSHFDGQNVLESGAEQPYGKDTGWLNRAIALLPGAKRGLGMALNAHLPLMMRGTVPVGSWSPSLLPSPPADTVERLAALYGETDPMMAVAFASALRGNTVARGTAGQGGAQFAGLMAAAARFLAAPDGARIAMCELGGWDTHVNQMAALGPLASNLATLDRGIAALKSGLGEAWSNTVVFVVSEFGRTVAQNGTQGSDHGVGGAAFLLGGSVRGARVIADWPGLAPERLYEGRDLQATTDLRAIACGVLRDHLGIDEDRLAPVFPSQRRLRGTSGLIRT